MKRAIALCVFLAFAGIVPAAGASEFGIAPAGFSAKILDREGLPEGRAGSHPDLLQLDFALEGEETPLRAFAFEFPAGLGISTGAVPECPRELVEKEEECPPESQVGFLSFNFFGGGKALQPIFELEPAPGELASFGSTPGAEGDPILELRSDFGIVVGASDLPKVTVSDGRLELWGVPADHQSGTAIPRRPFLTLPTKCGKVPFGFRARSWEPEAPWLTAETAAEAPLSGCADLAFEPHLAMQLDNARADSPTGARIDLTMHEDVDPDGLASAQLKDATIEMPEGLTVSPAGVAGITPCTDAQFGLDETTASSCPPSSRVGTMELESPGLQRPLSGAFYFGEPSSGERLRTFVEIAVQGGTFEKSVSAMQPDLSTGRISSVLSEMPPLTLSRLTINFEGGPRALLASPVGCGSFPARGSFRSYASGAEVTSTAPVSIVADADGSPCQSPPPFSPRLIVSGSSQAAGRPTAVSMSVQRRAGEQMTRRFSVSLPPGLSTALGEIELCPDAAAATGTCPAAGRIGSAELTVGSGASPVPLHGDVYAAGPWHGAPFSSIMVLHSRLGPFDLGTLVVRSAMQVQPRTQQVTVVSDSMPGLVGGLPVRVQTIRMTMDRPGLIRNPTSCAPATFSASFESAGGAQATAADALAVKGCKKLGFKPRFSMTLDGGSKLRKDSKPGLRISAHFRRGDANLRSMKTSLPDTLRFDISGLGEICPRRDAIEGLCTAKSRVGATYARSSTLSKPLKGAIYVVQPKGKGRPDLWVSLAAMGLHVNIKGTTSVRDGRLVTTLSGLPDMPLSDFTMQLRGGSNGVISLAVAPCAKRNAGRLMSHLTATGQNGARRKLQLRAGAHCKETPS